MSCSFGQSARWLGTNFSEIWVKLEIVDQWSTRIPTPWPKIQTIHWFPHRKWLYKPSPTSIHKKDPSRIIVCALERTWEDVSYFSSFIAKSSLNDLEDIGQGQRSLHLTHLLMLVIICAKYGKNPSGTLPAVEWTRQDVTYFTNFTAKSWLNDLESQGQRSLCVTPSHASDHMLIWKESIHNSRHYRADTVCGRDGWTEGRMDEQSETKIPLTTLLCRGINMLILINNNGFGMCSATWP